MTKQTMYPALTYLDAPAAIAWLGRAFGLVPEHVYAGQGNTIDHAQLRAGTDLVMLGSERDDGSGRRTSPTALGRRGTLALYVHVADPEAMLATAQAANATIVRPLAGTDYDDSRSFTAEDCEGYVWAFGTYAPSAESNLSPCVRYDDGPRAFAWFQDKLGFEKNMLVPDENGGITHGELRFGSGILMCGSRKDDDLRFDTPARVGATTGGVYLYCADPDALFARAQAGNVEISRPLQDMDYGSREFGVRDPEGNRFSFGTYRP